MVDVGEVARRAVLDHLLALAPWCGGGHDLVLRGSMPMVGWYLGRARPPGDLDWLVYPTQSGRELPAPALYGNLRDLARELPEERLTAPPDHDPDEFMPPYAVSGEHLRPAGFRVDRRRRAERGVEWNPPAWLTDDPADGEPTEPDLDEQEPYQSLLELVRSFPVAPGPTGEIRLDPDGATVSGLWGYYGSTPGQRLTLPWHAPGLPRGTAQCDFTEVGLPELIVKPVQTAIPRGDGGWPTTVPTVSRDLALAWKLQWLHTDNHPEDGPDRDEDDEPEDPRPALGKDLYDAVLLAEDPATELELPRLRTLFEPAWHHVTAGPAAIAAWTAAWQVDWPAFRTAHPHVTGTATDWLTRLATALTHRWYPPDTRRQRCIP